MPKELLAESHIQKPTDDPNAVYASALNIAAGTIMERWATGCPSPGPGSRLQNVHLKNKSNTLVGFRLYLVTQEPIHLGPTPVEYLDE